MTDVESAGTSTSSEKDRMEATAEAAKILSQGKRNLVCGEVPIAVNQFQEACKVLAKAYGETAKECAEAYFYYGQALLDLARMETGVLGNALQGVPEEDEEETSKSADEQFENGDKLDVEEREKLRIEVYDAMAEKEKEEKEKSEKDAESMETDEKGDAKKNDKEETNKEEKDDKEETNKEEKDDKEETNKEEKDDKEETNDNKEKEGADGDTAEEGQDADTAEEGDTAKEGDTAEEGDTAKEGDTAEEGDTAMEGDTAEEGEDTAEEEEKKDKEEDPDDVSNLQLAWEMLELAKVIYLKEDSKESKLKAADSYLKLGEVSLETEQYEQSVADFNECLKIQQSVLEPEDRSLAETHYQLGLAYCFNKQYDESIDSYRAAIKVLEDRIAKLSKIVEGEEKIEDSKEEKIVEGEEKIEDSKEEKDKETTEDPVKAAENEIKEIKELLPDMRQKIEDSEEEKKNYEQLKAMAKEAVGFGSPAQETEQTNTDNKPASNISHLIRRKRKPDEEEDADQDTKKTKQEENGAGDAVVNGVKENGEMEVDKKKVEDDAPQPAEAVAS